VAVIVLYAISPCDHQCCEFESCSLRGALDTTLCDTVCQWLAVGRLWSLGPPASGTNKTDRHDISKILLKVALSTITHRSLGNMLIITDLTLGN